jgi:hypothetical protein
MAISNCHVSKAGLLPQFQNTTGITVTTARGASHETWLPETFSVIDPGKDIDIIVLAATQPLLTEPI